ncbi:DUF4190 domain-containing protein [Streptomyces sp. NPDC059788]|uniref:DUF4190 domain-containing protein n=1 Tax=Streptomyces sp. NPDC059788 TaxID=3346948 RepID=UPI003664CCA5
MSHQMHHPHAPQAPTGMPPHQAARNGLGVAALVLGIIGALSGLIPLFFWLAGILGLLALVFGLVGRGRAKRGQATNKGMATAGAVFGAIALILSVVGVVITATAVNDAVKEVNKSLEGSEAKPEDGQGGTSAKSYKGGATAVYDTGLNVTVSKPSPYTADEIAVGHEQGHKSYKVTVRIENKGGKDVAGDLVMVEARAGKDGKAAERIYDSKVGSGFSGSLQPGKTATADFAFDVPAGAKDLDVQIRPGFDHKATHWQLGL